MLIDRIAAAAGLIVLSPLLLLVCVIILLDEGRPILFRQWRIGCRGRAFQILKFRSMKMRRSGSLITVTGDDRVTRVGRWLRKFKIDELPQLWNVMRGDMALIGPRPEVPEYVDLADERWKRVLQVRPGITDLATLVYREEEQILAGSSDADATYRQIVLPAKLALNLEYQSLRSVRTDLRLLLWTLRYSFIPAGFDARRIEEVILGR